jgi:hypothetical protein
MFVLAADWATLSSLATALGTLVLAIATFAAVRSSNRSAKIAEIAFQEQRRPVLIASRFDDPRQKLNFADGHWSTADGGHASAEHVDGNVYLAISLRNVGSGIGVCQGWAISAGQTTSSHRPTHRPLDEFRLQTRDLYIPGGDVGMWQGALRNPEDSERESIAHAIDEGEIITVELLYSDLAGRQRTITRFGLVPVEYPDRPAGDRLTSMSRHWFLDWDGPRPANADLAAQIMRIDDEINQTQRTTE